MKNQQQQSAFLKRRVATMVATVATTMNESLQQLFLELLEGAAAQVTHAKFNACVRFGISETTTHIKRRLIWEPSPKVVNQFP